MIKLEIEQFAYGNTDNYGVLVFDPNSGLCAAVDAGDASAYIRAAEGKGWTISQIWVTHKHSDHVAGLAVLAAHYKATVYGPHFRNGSPLDVAHTSVCDGAEFQLGEIKVQVIETPGHTLEMNNYYLPKTEVLFSGDTLFALGCGRLFEGSPAMMWQSLQKLMALPKNTVVYCAHEYTLSNAAFAHHVDPTNLDLQQRINKIKDQRQAGQATVPFLLAEDLDTNPFLRPSDSAIRRQIGAETLSDQDVFSRLRALKNNF